MSTDQDADVRLLEEHLQSNPNSLVFARLADAYLRSQQIERAMELCEEGTKLHPYYATGHLILGKCYLATKQYDQAEKEFKRVLLFDPKYLAAHKLYGDLMHEIGWANTCLNSYKKILQIDPLDETARLRLRELQDQVDQTQADATPDFEPPPVDDQTENLESVEPLPITSDEEEMLFEGDKPQLDEQPVGMETPSPAPEADTEKFSSILDDIFKDEVVQEEDTPTDSIDIYSSEEDLVSEIQKEPDRYFENVKRDEPDAPSQEPEGHSNSVADQQKPPFQDAAPEQAADIMPAPAPAAKKKEPAPPPETNKGQREKIVTPTLGEIYTAQGQYVKAINVFERLLTKNPDNKDFAKKIEQLKEKLAESGNAPKN
ncbi:tetratricopeptide repeat protein [bacterium]|nr:tetratricopeptide repeat protein [bacterium]